MNKLLKNSALLVIGNFASKLLVFFLVPFYTSILTTEEYAICDLLVTTVNLSYPLFSLMIESAVLRFSLDENVDHSQVLSTALWIELTGFFVLMPLTVILMPLTDLRGYVLLFLVYYMIHSLFMILMNFTKGRNKVAIYAVAGVCNTVVLIVCNIIFLSIYKMGINGYILAMIIGYAASSAVLLFATKEYKLIWSPRKLNLSLSRKMLKYSLPLIPNSISWWINSSSDRYIMKIFRATSELGVYTVAYKIPSIMAAISSIMISAWEISAVDDFGTEKGRQFFSKMYMNYLNIQVICCTGILILLKPLAHILFKNNFFNAWVFVPALLVGGVFNTLGLFLGTIFTASKQTTSIFTTTLLGAIVNVALNLLLIPNLGGQGAAIGTLAGYVVVYVTRFVKSSKIMKLDINQGDNILLLLSVCILAVVSCYNTFLSIIIGALILIWERQFILKIACVAFEKIKSRKKSKL